MRNYLVAILIYIKKLFKNPTHQRIVSQDNLELLDFGIKVMKIKITMLNDMYYVRT